MATHFGAGGEAVGTNGVGVGGEVGDIVWSSGRTSSQMGVFSFNVSAHTNRTASTGAQPFFTGGVSALAMDRWSTAALNMGAGVDIWSVPNAGVRLEVRSQIHPAGFGLMSFRIGVVFR